MQKFLLHFPFFLAVVVGVHLFWSGVVRPLADLTLAQATAEGLAIPRTLPIIFKDIEQEICVILLFWGSYMILMRLVGIWRQSYLFSVDILKQADDAHGDSTPSLTQTLNNLEQLPSALKQTALLQTLTASLRRFLITRNVQNTSDAINSALEAQSMQQEAGNAMIRYLIWAIPSIGFIGTVRGIGEALALADQAMAGDITGMTGALGVAFNSTFVALLISIALMLLLHMLQREQDGLLIRIQSYCEHHLLNRISRTPASHANSSIGEKPINEKAANENPN